ncbi:uncharacterized protein TNCV_2993641 [Trichonephila clavipes]|nr:uncharacterized protein TNCV_2993641 [Trichonephila clavipes]
MKKAIDTTLHHSISTDQNSQQSKCPIGADSWCFYQSARAKGQNPGLHKQVGTPINEIFLPHILSIYQRLASNELLERCINCGTQNANESLHNMIWSKCPKEIFVTKNRVKNAALEAIWEFDKDTLRTVRETPKALNIPLGKCSHDLGVMLESRKRLFRTRRKNTKYQHDRKLIKKAILKRERLINKREGVTYESGYF